MDIRMAAAEPMMASTLRKRAKSSTTKLPPKLTSLPSGSKITITPAIASSTIDSTSMRISPRGVRNTPNMRRAMPPAASTISGSSGRRPAASRDASIALPRQCRRLHAGNGVVEIVHQLRHGDCRDIEHQVRIDAEHDGQRNQRRENHHLTPTEVLDAEQARLLQLAENHLAIEPQRVAGGKDRAERGERRHPIVDA